MTNYRHISGASIDDLCSSSPADPISDWLACQTASCLTSCFSSRSRLWVESRVWTGGSDLSWHVSPASLWNRRTKHLHGLQNQRQMIHKRVHGHSEDPSFVCAPPPETHREEEEEGIKPVAFVTWQLRRSEAVFAHTDSVLPDTVSCLLMPPFLGSRSGDRERRAMAASRDDGKGTSRELQDGQGRRDVDESRPAETSTFNVCLHDATGWLNFRINKVSNSSIQFYS